MANASKRVIIITNSEYQQQFSMTITGLYNRSGKDMIHKAVLDNDDCELRPGDPTPTL